MDQLPLEVMLKIFSFCNVRDIITKIRFVNKSWYRLCSDKDVWKSRNIILSTWFHIDVQRESNRCQSMEQIIQLAKYTEFICNLGKYDRSCRVTLENIKLLLPYCPRLVKLHLRCSAIDYSILEIITKNCTFLENLYLFRPVPFIQNYFLLSELIHLKSLSLDCVTDLRDHHLVTILQRCKNLYKLRIDRACKISIISIKQLPSTKISALYLSCLDGLTDLFWDYISDMPNLEHLFLEGNYNVKLRFLKLFIRKCVKLKSYGIYLNNDVSLFKYGIDGW